MEQRPYIIYVGTFLINRNVSFKWDAFEKSVFYVVLPKETIKVTLCAFFHCQLELN
jgi:hypothetical protein